MATETIRQRIIDAFDTRMKGILTASGYQTDVGKQVYAFRDAAFETSDMPAMKYKDTPEPEGVIVTIAGPDSQQEFPLEVEIEAKAMAGDATAAALRSIIGDIHKAVGVDQTWGGLALYTEPLQSDMATDQPEKTIGSATVRLRITYRTKLWDPYNQ